VKTILFVHQSADLYGSDRVLLDLACGVQSRGMKAIVLLPTAGPLLGRLTAANVEAHVVPVARLTRASLSPLGLLCLPGEIRRALRAIDELLRGRTVHLVHSNTLAVLGGAFWAKRHRLPHLWHVHELLVSPGVVRHGFPWLLRWLADRVLCNSVMTAMWVLDEQPVLGPRTDVVWNGIVPREQAGHALASGRTFRSEVGCTASGMVCVAMVGRVNRLKGQALLVEAATWLWRQGVRNVVFVLVGSPPNGQEHYLEDLRKRVADSPARARIVLRDFQEDIWPVWEGCDIAVVPSTEPESFGLVAIEAMSSGKPVVAAGHGGLLDIVADGETGCLVPPNDVVALASALRRLIEAPALRERMGEAGRSRQAARFSLGAQIDATLECYANTWNQFGEANHA